MEEQTYLSKESKTEEEKFILSLPRIIDYAVGNAMAEVVPALEGILRMVSLPLHHYELAIRAELSARELASKVSALTELFGGDDVVSQVRLSSYNLDQFFSVLTKQMNCSIGDRLHGVITYSIEKNSGTEAVFDARRVCMILYHLVSNAIQHGKTENKDVKIQCKCEEDCFTFSVIDHGGGIPAKVKPVLFTKFRDAFQLSNLNSGMLPPRISGLGLPLCRKLTEDMGGELTYRNYYNGAKFTIALPQSHLFMRETSYFAPDDSLLNLCFASLFLFLEENKLK